MHSSHKNILFLFFTSNSVTNNIFTKFLFQYSFALAQNKAEIHASYTKM